MQHHMEGKRKKCSRTRNQVRIKVLMLVKAKSTLEAHCPVLRHQAAHVN